MIKNIIFDIGNVLAAFCWEENLKSFGFPEEEYEAIADAVFRGSDWGEMDRGVLDVEEVIARFCKKAPEYAEDIRKVVYSYSGMIKQYPYAKTLLRTLKEHGYKVYFLSNYGPFGYERTKDELDFIEMMDGGLFSYEVQMIKPCKWIFMELMERYGLKAEECVFLDDNPNNAKAAGKAGIAGIAFYGLEQGLEELRKLGVDIEL